MNQNLLHALQLQVSAHYEEAKQIYLDTSKSKDLLASDELEFLFVNLANIYFIENDYVLAEQYYKRGLQANPQNHKIYYNLGVLCLKQELHSQAKNYLEYSYTISPNHFSTLLNLGICYKNLKEYEKAFQMLALCLEQKKDDQDVYYNLGNIYMATEQHNYAIKNYLLTLKLQKNYSKAYYSIGLCYHKIGRHCLAMRYLDIAISIKENYSDALFAKGLCLLQIGNFVDGWELYHHRWDAKNELKIPTYAVQFYNGEDLTDKVILVQGEQGFGDTIQFSRYLHYLQNAKKVYFALRDELKNLMQGSFDFVEVCGNNDTLFGVDYFVSLLDLPRIFKKRDVFLDISMPYLKSTAIIDLNFDKRYLNVGFVWQGNRDHKNDENRSIPFEYFEKLFELEQIRFYSLQKGEEVDFSSYENVFDLSLNFSDFNECANIMNKLDLIISIDSAPIHLAGAIGVNAVLLLPKFGEWRWLEKRDNSPYYPSIRIIRQQKTKSWDEVFRSLKIKLERECMQKSLIDESGFNRLKVSKYGYCVYNKHDMYVGKSIDLYGEYCDDESTILMQLCKEGDTVVEVGANIGTHTMMLAKHVGPDGIVYAFEPQRIIFQTLCANIALNSLDNVFAFQMGVGQTSGVIYVPKINYKQTNNFGGVELGMESVGEKVPLVALDSFLEISKIKLLKIDVEGMEKDVLVGSKGILEKFKPYIYLENDRREKSQELIEYLWSLGYELYWHLPRLFNKNNFYKKTENTIGNFVSANMLCIHKERICNIQGFEKVVDAKTHPLSRK